MAEMEEKKALLVFCEGAHDVAFVRQVFKLFFGIDKVEWKFSQYPSPFNSLFQTNVEKHAARDLSLDMAYKFFLPDWTLAKDDRLILLFNSGGKTAYKERVKAFLGDFLPLFSKAKVFDNGAASFVNESKYLFLFDADHHSPQDVISKAKDDLSAIGNTDWRMDAIRIPENDAFGGISTDKAFYIWANSSGKGTLEEIVLPLFETEQKELVERAAAFVNDSFEWKTGRGDTEKARAEIARKKKAIITTVGQRKKPGGSMSVILDQGKFVSELTFRKDEKVLNFVKFVSEFTGIPIAGEL